MYLIDPFGYLVLKKNLVLKKKERNKIYKNKRLLIKYKILLRILRWFFFFFFQCSNFTIIMLICVVLYNKYFMMVISYT